MAQVEFRVARFDNGRSTVNLIYNDATGFLSRVHCINISPENTNVELTLGIPNPLRFSFGPGVDQNENVPNNTYQIEAGEIDPVEGQGHRLVNFGMLMEWG